MSLALGFANLRMYEGPQFNNVQDAEALRQKRIKDSLFLRSRNGLVRDMNDAD